jgi:hypothetical protein
MQNPLDFFTQAASRGFYKPRHLPGMLSHYDQVPSACYSKDLVPQVSSFMPLPPALYILCFHHPNYEPASLLEHIVGTVCTKVIIRLHCCNSDFSLQCCKNTFCTIVVYTIVAFVITLIVLQTSMPMMQHEEHFWNVSVLQIVHLSNLFISNVCRY